jgi:hypothetical protein
MWWPRKSSSVRENTHFSRLRADPLAVRMEKSNHMCSQCCSLVLLYIPSSSKKEKKAHQDVIFETLEDLKEAKRCDNHCFWNVHSDGNLVVSFYQVNFWKDSPAHHAVFKWLHVGQRLPDQHCDPVRTAIFATDVLGAILLGDQVERGRPGQVWPANIRLS